MLIYIFLKYVIIVLKMGDKMIYRYEDYRRDFSIKFESIKKNIASRKFAKYIFENLNSGKYSNIDYFYSENKTFSEFLKKYLKSKKILQSEYSHNMLMHFNEGMTEKDYQDIIKSIIRYINYDNNIKYTNYANKINNSKKHDVNFNFLSLQDQLSMLDDLSADDRTYIKEVLDSVDDVDNVKIDIKNKIAIDNDGNYIPINKNVNEGYTTSKTYQKSLLTNSGVKYFSDDLDNLNI